LSSLSGEAIAVLDNIWPWRLFTARPLPLAGKETDSAGMAVDLSLATGTPSSRKCIEYEYSDFVAVYG